MNKILTLVLLASILLFAGPGETLAQGDSPAATESKASVAIPRRQQTLLFFMNPHGRPCQEQDLILQRMSKQLDSQNVRVQYVKTTDMASARPLFMKYGVRALPMIIVLDANGSVKKRFSPGIQNQFVLAAAFE